VKPTTSSIDKSNTGSYNKVNKDPGTSKYNNESHPTSLGVILNINIRNTS
jgi:hypothetical protein